jgi:hypothetical protein
VWYSAPDTPVRLAANARKRLVASTRPYAPPAKKNQAILQITRQNSKYFHSFQNNSQKFSALNNKAER